MGIFRRLFSTDPEALQRKADGLFAAGDYGSAKLAYERAREATSGEAAVALGDKIARCTNGIARERIDEGKAHLANGSVELAIHEFEGAREVAADEDLIAEAQALIDGIEAEDARQGAVSQETTDEERIALIVGQWQEAQAAEYEEYGDALLEGLVLLHKESLQEGRKKLETVLANARNPRYLWLELGRARLLTDDVLGGKEALEAFVRKVDDDASENRLSAHLALARIADEAGGFEEAMSQFEAAVKAMPEDYRPYLAMGAFLRDNAHGREALEVLDTALELCTSRGQADWRLLQELGLAHEQAGNADVARSFLEQVVEIFRSNRVMDLPVLTAKTLAKLYEADGRLERAADMYRALSRGSDAAQHARYHFEAGRLLKKLALDDEAHRMLTRAKALTTDNALLEEIDGLLGAEKNPPPTA